MEINLGKIEKIIGYEFKNNELLKLAFTHSSFAYTHNLNSNERLEFLGDSILNFCTTIYLYNNFEYSEGDSSKIRAYLVSSENVSKYIFDRKLENYLLCDNFKPQNSVNVMGDLYEAIIGAMYLDSDLETCRKFIFKSLNYSIELIKETSLKTRDYKTELQEFVQKIPDSTLQYILVKKTGPAHLPEFTMQVEINSKKYALATSGNKKQAENMCAKLTLDMLKNNNNNLL